MARREPRCAAHGHERCSLCSLTHSATLDSYDRHCPACANFAAIGMHAANCPNRVVMHDGLPMVARERMRQEVELIPVTGDVEGADALINEHRPDDLAEARTIDRANGEEFLRSVADQITDQE